MRRLLVARTLVLCLLALGVLGGSVPPIRAAATPQVPVHGGTLVEGLLDDPDSLLPNTSGQLYALLVQQTLFAPLFYSDDKGHIQPGLASVVPTLANGGISKDGRTYTFHLRPGLKWSDGKPLTARDVDYSWRLWVNPKLAPAPFSTIGIDRVGATTISADNLTITFRLVQPYAPFLSDWTDSFQPLPAHILQKIPTAQVSISTFAHFPTVNSGPFTLQSFRHGDEITVTRNRNYYQAKSGYPYLYGITFKVFSDQATLLAALGDHTVDTAWLLPITNLGALRSMPGVTTLPLHDGNWEAAIINMRHIVFQDVRVRQALEYGLNRDAEVASGWHGLADLIGSDLAPGSTMYSPAITPYPYNPTMAAKLLDAAGWRLGADGYRHKGTQILSITYSTSFNKPWRQIDEAQALSDFERLGIQLVIRNYPAGVFQNSILPQGHFDLAEFVFDSTLDPEDIAAFGTHFTPPQGTNYGAYSNPEFDRLAELELLTTDPVRRAAISFRIQQILHDDVPALWLYSPDDLAAANSRVHNYRPAPFSMDTWNAWEWWVSPAPAQ